MHVDINDLQAYIQTLTLLKQRNEQLYTYWNANYSSLRNDGVLISFIQQNTECFVQTNNIFANLIQHITTGIQIYHQLEEKLVYAIERMNSFAHTNSEKNDDKNRFLNITSETLQTKHQLYTNISSTTSIFDYLKNGVKANAAFSFTAANIKALKDMKYAQIVGGIRVGDIHVSADAKGTIYANKKLKPVLSIVGLVEGSIATLDANIHTGTDDMNLDVEANVGVGVVKGEAKAVISKEEITLKADASAAAVRGEIKGSVSLFGIRVSANASGDIGSIGGGAEFSSKKGEFEIGGHFSFLAGVGLKIKVDY